MAVDLGGTPGQGYSQRQVTIIIVCSVLFLISTASVVLRLVARYVMRTWWWWDDTLCILALLSSWLVNIFTIITTHFGLGRHMAEIEQKNLFYFGLFYWLQELSWCFSMFFIIECIMWFYLRLFPKRWIRVAFWIVSAFTVAWLIMSICVLVFQCRPVQYFWDKELGGSCINIVAFYLTNSATNMITLFTVLVLPLGIVWSLQIAVSRKIGLACSLSLGSFVCGISIYRLVAIKHVNENDLPWSSNGSLLWSAIESNVAIASACIPSLVPLILIALGKKPLSFKVKDTEKGLSTRSANIHGTRDYFDRYRSRTEERISDEIPVLHNTSQATQQNSITASDVHVPQGGIKVTHEVDLLSKPRSQDSVLGDRGIQPRHEL